MGQMTRNQITNRKTLILLVHALVSLYQAGLDTDLVYHVFQIKIPQKSCCNKKGRVKKKCFEKMASETASRQEVLKKKKAAKKQKKEAQNKSVVNDGPDSSDCVKCQKLEESNGPSIKDVTSSTPSNEIEKIVKDFVKNMKNQGVTVGNIELVDDLKGENYEVEKCLEGAKETFEGLEINETPDESD
ncbi:hypothetical protein GCK72_011012 [Caenorhabditis remanei]|uniref:Uncharacterized protein n=1 Tax=Caenorhabditis remanei TaxID=31234 RepID=A0A6A5H4F8_CAERE|nr:hypothetical protein GCK72_011012 [Caenorhabditis remanei]KAF1762750.1 hypothetical protein GCK72_011012 [Caenorhabditis remanei]